MALTHKHRSALHEGLSGVVDEEAVNEMLAYFPTRDGDEPIGKDFLRAELSGIRAEMSDLRADLTGEMASLRSDIKDDMASLRSEMTGEMAGLRADLTGEMAGLRSDVKDDITRALIVTIIANIGVMVAFAAVVVAAVRL